jgi:hypothetical protein
MPSSLKVLDTYLRGLKRLIGLAEEVDALEGDVSEREAGALRRILSHFAPLVPRLARPISIREPWLDDGPEKAFREPGVLLINSFQQDQGPRGHVTHHAYQVVLLAGGRLVELTLEGSWTQGEDREVRDASWHVESRECEPDPEFARKHLRSILSGILDALREALVRGRADRDELKRRLALLEEVDEILS